MTTTHPVYTLSDYDYDLPHAQIATHPASPRDAARLLHWRDGQPEHLTFKDLPKLLKKGDLVVVNSSRVIPARLFATRPRMTSLREQDGVVEFEILLHRPLGEVTRWECFMKNSKRVKEGHVLDIIGGAQATVVEKGEGTVVLSFHLPVDEVFPYFEAYGEMPLPPYIDRPDGAEDADSEEYQTVYAKEEGSVAAPTAGLHFTDDLIDTLKAQGVQFAEVTLHVGAGTFQPVQVENIAEHKMHAEWGCVDAETVALIKQTKAAGGRVVAVGTTTTRLLETASRGEEIMPWQGDTDIFMTPGFEFKTVDVLITNFHLPKSTLMMLVAAFMGFDEMHTLYKTAIEEEYRFYSYGDGCLLTLK